jgi:hypothetical protein
MTHRAKTSRAGVQSRSAGPAAFAVLPAATLPGHDRSVKPSGMPAGVRGGERPDAVPSARAAGAAGAAGRLGTSSHNCNHGEPNENHVSDHAERASELAQPLRAQLAQRLAAQNTDWHRARADALGLPVADRMRLCGHGAVELASPQGEVVELPIGCAQHLCPKCEAKRLRKVGRRARLAIEAHDARQRRRHRRATLLTLTVRDTGDPVADRERIMAGWKRWRSWWRKRYGWSFAFVLVVELTAGSADTGHAHAHVVAWMPRWFDWKKAQAAWGRAVEDGNLDIQQRQDDATSKQALGYLTAYLNKALQLAKVPPDVAASWLVGTYGKRRVTTSWRFWLADDKEPWELLAVRPAGFNRNGLRGWWRREYTPKPWPDCSTSGRAPP